MPGDLSYKRFVAVGMIACLISTLLYYGWNLLFFQYNSAPKVIQGELDLSGWDFARDGNVRLNGEWAFYWQRLVGPEEFHSPEAPAPSLYAEVPASWNHLKVDGRRVPSEGFATYCMTLKLKPGQDLLAVRIPTINTAYRLWVNGSEAASAGTVGMSAEGTTPQYHPAIAVMHTHESTVELVLQVSNYSHHRGGVWQPLEVGKVDSMVGKQALSVGFDMLLIGSVMIMGLYHLGLFTVRTKDWPILFFGLFCLLICLRMTMLSEIVLTKLFPNFDWTVQILLEYTSAALAMPLFALFFSGLYPRESSRSFNMALCLACIGYTAVVAVLTPLKMTEWLIVLQVYLLCGMLYILVIVILAFLRKREGAGILLVSCILFALSIVNDMLYAHELVKTTDKMTVFGLLIFIISQALLLSIKLSKAFSNEERLSAQLTELNNGLYGKIKEHTHSLELANEALKQTNDELSRLEISRSHLLSNISHDLGTPLTTIQCYIEAILDGMVDTEEQKDRYLRLIHGKVLGMDRLIEDLFHLSQLEARQITFKKQTFRTDRLMEMLFSRYELDTRNAGIRYSLTMNSPASSGRAFAAVEVDLERMHQVFSNLIFNAIKFTREGGSIEVEMADDEDGMLCRVTDSGEGIVPEDLPYVFDRFYSSNQSRSSVNGGKGLGLSISKEIVESHGGRIWVERSEPQRGTSICFWIPVRREEMSLTEGKVNAYL
ncbi:sensor histidine kinase [Paenibacillus filicis]|uniref:histidine kinase n=1 Tax=Paenibacillus gyeongsangnamensis TaxID=3388067 RepID=A0ABT4Q9H9_9BACL|nr:sensor histidine kinase [Paenibacillus filicis]MCZ8513536.1 sensor histidine kinase [Paenibacillus filicis]